MLGTKNSNVEKNLLVYYRVIYGSSLYLIVRSGAPLPSKMLLVWIKENN